MVITNIEPKTVTVGETVKFTLTVQNYNSQITGFSLAGRDLDCTDYDPETNLLYCQEEFTINSLNKIDLYNPKKTLFVDSKPTNVSVTFKRPSVIKTIGNVIINDDSGTEILTNQLTKFTFKVNDNELYNPTIYIELTIYNNVDYSYNYYRIINCTIDDEEIHEIYCYYKFDESFNGKTLRSVSFKSVGVLSSEKNINNPSGFMNINELDEDEYYVSSSEQYVYFEVDSAYKMNEKSIKLVPEIATNPNITLNSCTIKDYNNRYAKCSGKLDKIGAYDVYVDNSKITANQKLFVYPELPAIRKVSIIKPSNLLISSLETTFTLEVDYIVNLDKAVFSLVNSYNNNNKYYLTKCAIVEGTNNEITCVGTIKNVGYFNVYLNGLIQSANVRVFSSYLSKAFYISPNLTKFTNISFASTSKDIIIVFDTTNDFESKTITLKGTNNSFATLDFKQKDSDSFSLVYYATFPVNDTYYLYINNVKQNNVSITLTTENYTSEISSISPTLVATNRYIEFTLTVDTNFGIENAGIYLIQKTNNSNINKMTCKADSSDSTKALCFYYGLSFEGDYYVSSGNKDFQTLIVKAKSLPINLVGFSPYSIESSTEAQKVFLYFKADASNYKDKIKFAGKETLTTTCELSSNYALICSATFTNDDKYAITIDDIYFDSFIYVNKEDNTYQEDVIDDDDTNIIDDSDSNVNYIKISSLLLLTLLLF